MKVAVVGGGPGGLMTARLLEQKSAGHCRVTLFEASSRLGGKIDTRQFAVLPAMYEAGVAECYDYEAFGRDPLKALVRELGLTPVPTHGHAVSLNGVILRDDSAIAAHCGERTWKSVEHFRRRAAVWTTPAKWCDAVMTEDTDHPWAHRSCEELLAEVADPAARRYLEMVMHSDMATEPHLTSGLVGLRNVLKNVHGYGTQYTIDGGMGMLPRKLAADLRATTVRLDSPVTAIGRGREGQYSVDVRRGWLRWREQFDAVVVALPYARLRDIEWAGERLRRAMAAHVGHYDHPAHYLRISVLFDRPFWREWFDGSWLMLDAFGGCCVYDEPGGSGAASAHGVLGWLLAGSDALSAADVDDDALVARAIGSLPGELQPLARQHALDARVHRWVGALSGRPGGFPLRDARVAHQPEPIEHERIVMVGDYLFDSTLNGVLRSAEIATDVVLGEPRLASPPPLLERLAQEDPRFLPVAADGSIGDVERVSDFGIRQAAEIAELDHFGHSCV